MFFLSSLLRRLTSIFETETKEQKKRVAKKFLKVVREFRLCDKKMQNKWIEEVWRVTRKNREGWRRVNDKMLVKVITSQ